MQKNVAENVLHCVMAHTILSFSLRRTAPTNEVILMLISALVIGSDIIYWTRTECYTV